GHVGKELALEPAGLLGLALQPFALADIADRRRDRQSLVALQGTEADLNREFRAVAAHSEQLEPDSDLAYMGDGKVREAPALVRLPDMFGHEDFDMLPEELVSVIAKQPLRLLVNQKNRGGFVHDHDRIGRRFEQRTEPGFVARELSRLVFDP